MKPKKIKKSIESLERQKLLHEEKIKNYEGKNYALIKYWGKEIESIKDKIEEMNGKLKKRKKQLILKS